MIKEKKTSLFFLGIAAIGLIICGYLFYMAYTAPLIIKTPAMPAEKSAPNAIIEKALQLKSVEAERDILIKKLKKTGIDIRKGCIADDEVIVFLKELLTDKESQQIFNQFTKADITIWMSDFYSIYAGGVVVDIRDSVNKVAKWLREGKI